MINQVVELLKKNNLTIGSIESLTGGLFASTLTSIPGVSSIFKGSVVTYATEIKESVVGVSKETALLDACKIEHDLSEESFLAIKNHIEKVK